MLIPLYVTRGALASSCGSSSQQLRYFGGSGFKSIFLGISRYFVTTERREVAAGSHNCKRDAETRAGSRQEEVDANLKAVQYLNSLRNFEREGVPKGAGTESDAGFDLQRMSRLLQSLGDPLSKYPVVHVAGTKGKGSTVAFLSSILRNAGFRVGSYTSPHILSIRERITSGETGQPISSWAFNQLFDDLHETIHEAVATESGLITHFEVLTALAFAQFAKEKVDLAVVEAGLGGARDATNVIRAEGLIAAVIVGIGEEHLEALGGSLESIAVAKAGIIKDGCPVILGRQGEALAEKVVRRVAASKGAIVIPAPSNNAIYDQKGISADSRGPYQICDVSMNLAAAHDIASGETKVWHSKDLKIRMLGMHQLDNVVTAIQTTLCMRGKGWKISDSAIKAGVEHAVLPGRFQVATPTESMKLGSLGATVVVDGAHTVNSAAALAYTLSQCFPDESVAMVVAMAADKDHFGFAREILQGTKSIIILTTSVDIAGSAKRSASPSSLTNSFIRAGQGLNFKIHTRVNHDSDRDFAFDTLSTHPPKPTETSCLVCNSGLQKSRLSITMSREGQLILVEEADCMQLAIAKAARYLQEMNRNKPGVICVTGSLHAVSATLYFLGNTTKS